MKQAHLGKAALLGLTAFSATAFFTSLGAAAPVSSPTPLTATLPMNDDWNVQFGEPARDGTVEIEIDVRFTDHKGKRDKKKIKVEVAIKGDDTSNEKRGKIQEAIQGELAKDSNKVNDEPVIDLGGAGSTLNFDPRQTAAGGNASNTKIKNIKVDDGATDEKDKVHDPSDPNGILSGEPSSLAIVQALGSITGEDSQNRRASTFSVFTDQGDFVVVLKGTMKKSDVILELGNEMAEAGLTTWVDFGLRQEPTLYILGTDSVGDVGATTSDDGLTASLQLMQRQN